MKTGSRVAQSGLSFAGSCATCGALLDRTHLEDAPDGLHCVFCGARQEWIADGTDGAAAPVGVGETLRRARQARGESLEHASRVTHINERFLQALEDDEPCGAFPGAVYGRFFLREYAEHLALEPTPLVRGFDDAATEPDVEPFVDTVTARSTRRDSRIAAVLAAILFVALATISWWTGGSQDAPAAIGAPPAGAGSARATIDRTAPPFDVRTPPATPHGLVVVVHLVDRCWVQAVVDGRTLPGRTFLAGGERRFRAKRTVELTLGNAGGAHVRVNGRAVRVGPGADVTTLTFAWRDGRLILPAGTS